MSELIFKITPRLHAHAHPAQPGPPAAAIAAASGAVHPGPIFEAVLLGAGHDRALLAAPAAHQGRGAHVSAQAHLRAAAVIQL